MDHVHAWNIDKIQWIFTYNSFLFFLQQDYKAGLDAKKACVISNESMSRLKVAYSTYFFLFLNFLKADIPLIEQSFLL